MSNPILIINQIFDIQQKAITLQDATLFDRNFNRLYALFEEDGYIIQNPTGEAYTASRTDCEINIVGNASTKMTITKTLKPIIYKKQNGTMQLLQKGIVIAEKK